MHGGCTIDGLPDIYKSASFESLKNTIMDPVLHEALSVDTFRQNGYRLIDLLAHYLEKVKTGEELPVLEWIPPANGRKNWKEKLSRPKKRNGYCSF